jgi:hypothetical protein
MGAGQHPCCKTKVEQFAPVATTLHRTAIQMPYAVAALLYLPRLAEPTFYQRSSRELRGLPPPAPPGLNSVLRI